MSNNKVNMPSSQGGLVRYFDDYKSKLQISPVVVIALCIIAVVVLLMLHTFGHGWFGF